MQNVYCDESCHLQAQMFGMVMGCVCCATTAAGKHLENIKCIKRKHGIDSHCELKWVKVSQPRIDAYKELVDYFFCCPDMRFRAVVIKDKRQLNHAAFHQSYDEWYYKMYYELLRRIVGKNERSRIFVDIKDTRGKARIQKLWDVLGHNLHDFDQTAIPLMQEIRSNEVQIMSLVDVLIGAISYANRNLLSAGAKTELAQYIMTRARVNFQAGTGLSEEKFNVFQWSARSVV